MGLISNIASGVSRVFHPSLLGLLPTKTRTNDDLELFLQNNFSVAHSAPPTEQIDSSLIKNSKVIVVRYTPSEPLQFHKGIELVKLAGTKGDIALVESGASGDAAFRHHFGDDIVALHKSDIDLLRIYIEAGKQTLQIGTNLLKYKPNSIPLTQEEALTRPSKTQAELLNIYEDFCRAKVQEVTERIKRILNHKKYAQKRLFVFAEEERLKNTGLIPFLEEKNENFVLLVYNPIVRKLINDLPIAQN